jgi:5'-nucleotidase / UDP-sugar diphosphatase
MNAHRSPPAWPASVREYSQVIATTDVHSSLDRAGAMASSLHELRAAGALTADCGDFFEGTGYYVLGSGKAETALLCGLYDVTAPGNHGYRHHLTDPRLHAITVCANITSQSGTRVWQPLVIVNIGGHRTALTAVVGAEAFGSIPPADRAGHQVQDPAAALRLLHQRHRDGADSWVVLSHSGFEHDTHLARACPFIDVIFAGHCHSPRYGPETAGSTVVVKGAELAAGYSAAWPAADRWQAQVRTFGDSTVRGRSGLPAGVTEALDSAARLRPFLQREVGPLLAPFAGRTPPRDELLSLLCAAARTAAGADAALINLTCLREAHLGTTLTAGDLMTLEPFSNTLITLSTPDADATAARLAAGAGPVGVAPDPLPPGMVKIVTTDYLAATYLYDGPERPTDSKFSLPLRELLADLLLGGSGRKQD